MHRTTDRPANRNCPKLRSLTISRKDGETKKRIAKVLALTKLPQLHIPVSIGLLARFPLAT
jgi:hypothetical protein